MQTKVAVAKVLADRGITKYKMAQEMGSFPISINQWLSGTKMSEANRSLFYSKYGIEIDDTI